MILQPYAVRKIVTREELARFAEDTSKKRARRDLYVMLERAIAINDFVLMFSEEVINDSEHPHFGDTIVNLLAYPKSRFDGGAFQ